MISNTGPHLAGQRDKGGRGQGAVGVDPPPGVTEAETGKNSLLQTFNNRETLTWEEGTFMNQTIRQYPPRAYFKAKEEKNINWSSCFVIFIT